MRRLLCLAALFPLCGCVYTGENVEVNRIYRPAFLSNAVGDIVRVEDKEKGVVLYIHIVGTGKAEMQAFTVEGSRLHAAGR